MTAAGPCEVAHVTQGPNGRVTAVLEMVACRPFAPLVKGVLGLADAQAAARARDPAWECVAFATHARTLGDLVDAVVSDGPGSGVYMIIANERRGGAHHATLLARRCSTAAWLLYDPMRRATRQTDPSHGEAFDDTLRARPCSWPCFALGPTGAGAAKEDVRAATDS